MHLRDLVLAFALSSCATTTRLDGVVLDATEGSTLIRHRAMK